MEERDRIDIIATLHDRFNKPADEIISKMERMDDQADETGKSIDELESSLDKESRTTRDSSKAIESNTKARRTHADALDDESDAIEEVTDDVRAHTKAVEAGLKPQGKATQASRDAARAAEHLAEAVQDAGDATEVLNAAQKASTSASKDSTGAIKRERDARGRFIKVTEDATESIKDHTRATEESTETSEERTKQTDKDRDAWERWDNRIKKITSSIGSRFRPIGAFFQNYFKIIGAFRAILFSDIGALIPQLITGIVALGAAANASLGPMGRLVGTLGQVAPLIAAFAQTKIVFGMVKSGVSDALEVLNDVNATSEEIAAAQQKAGANTWAFAQEIQRLTDRFEPLKRQVRETFLEGMVPAVESLVNTYFPTLRKELTRTAEIMNGELREGMKGLETPGKQQTVADVMERSSVASGLFVDILFSLIDVFLELADAAGPAFIETLEAIDSRLDQFSDWISDNKSELQDFFLSANDTAGDFFKGLGFIAQGLYGISQAAEPLTDFLYGGLLDRLEGWSENMNDPKQQEIMAQNYEDMIPNLEAIGNLIGAVIDGAKEIATSEYFAPLVNDLADNGIPMIVEYMKALDETVGPPLLRISDALDDIDPDVLTSVLAPLGDALSGLAWALETVVPLFNGMPEPMQKMVMYGIGLAAMGLPGVFMLMFGALKPLVGLFNAGKWALGRFAGLLVDIAESPFGKKIGEMAKAVGRFFKPISDFLKKHLSKLGGGLIAKIFGKVAGKGILATLGPIGAVIGILWLLWDVIKWLWDNVKPFRDFFTGIWDWITNAWSVSIDWIVNTAVPWIVNAFKSIWQTIKDVAGWIAGFYTTWIKPVVDAIITFGKIVLITILTFIILPWKLLWNVAEPIVSDMIAWFKVFLPAAMDWLKQKWDTVTNALGVAWQAVKTVFKIVVGAIIGAAWWLYIKILETLGFIKAVWGAAWDWVSQKVTAVWSWIKNNVINPIVTWFLTYVWPMIKAVINALVNAFVWLRNKVSAVFSWIKNNIINPVLNWFMLYMWPVIRNVLQWLGDKFTWLRDRVRNIWDAIKNKLTSVYDNSISPIFDKFEAAIESLKEAFNVAKTSIGKAWDSIKEKAKVPIGFVIDKVYNEGILPVWNRLANVVDLDKSKRLKEVTWAADSYDTGGYTGPGSKYQPAGYVHADEYVIRKQSQRSLRRDAPGLLDDLNKHGSKALGYDSGGWVKPFQGNYSQNSGYGMRNGRMHSGVDFPTPSGTPMIAVSDGRIVGSSYHHAAGNKMSLQTDMRGIVAGYHHLSRFLAPHGSTVSKGDIIARSGNTGRSTGPHLHFSIAKDGKYVNPNPYLQGAGVAGTGESGGGGFWSNPFSSMLSGLLNKLPGEGGFKDIAVEATTSMINNAKEKATAWLNPFDSGSSSDPGDVAMGGNVAAWRSTAIRALKHTDSYSTYNLQSLMRRMNQESGGNARAINNWDSNAKRGTPSKGLMQVIDPTFRAHRDRSLSSNIYDPMANIVASIRYAKSRYGSLASAYNRRGGYFDGGLVDHLRFMGGPVETWGNTLVGEMGPEMFMPSGGGPASLLGLTGPEVMSFDREGSILPHQAVAALSTVNDAPAQSGTSTEESYYDVKVTVGGGATEIDVQGAVERAIAKAERKKRERR